MHFDDDAPPPPDHNPHAEIIRFSEWGGRPVNWLWDRIFARRKVSLLVGDQGKGKSFMMIDIAARLTRGETVPPGGLIEEGPADVVFLQADDENDDTLYPRLEGVGADMSRIYGVTNEGPRHIGECLPQITLAHDVECLHRAARMAQKCRLIVIDPITAFIHGMGANNHDAVRQLFTRLTVVAKLHDAAVVVITHTRKEGGDNFLHRAIGSQAFTITSRVVYTLVEDPVISERRLLLPAKMNLLPPRSWVGRAFRIAGFELEWEPEPVTLTPDDLRYLIARGIPTSDRVTDTVAWLKSLLAAGPRPSREILDLAHARRIPRNLLFEARARAGVRSRLDGRERRWYNELTPPQEEQCSCRDRFSLSLFPGSLLLSPQTVRVPRQYRNSPERVPRVYLSP